MVDDEPRIPGTYAEKVFGRGEMPETLYDPKPEVDQLVSGGFLDDPNRCYVCTETRPLDDRQVVTLHTNTGDRTCIVCERCRDLVDWEPLDHLIAMPDQARCSEHEGAAAQRAVGAINAETGYPFVAKLVDGEAENEPRHCGCVPPNTCEACSFTKLVDGIADEDDEGLPPMAPGSHWSKDGDGIDSEDGGAIWIDQGIVYTRGCGRDPADYLALLARYQRQRGCYPLDEMRGLAGELNTEAERLGPVFAFPSPGWTRKQERHRGLRDAAQRILAILDRLHAEGIC